VRLLSLSLLRMLLTWVRTIISYQNANHARFCSGFFSVCHWHTSVWPLLSRHWIFDCAGPPSVVGHAGGPCALRTPRPYFSLKAEERSEGKLPLNALPQERQCLIIVYQHWCGLSSDKGLIFCTQKGLPSGLSLSAWGLGGYNKRSRAAIAFCQALPCGRAKGQGRPSVLRVASKRPGR